MKIIDAHTHIAYWDTLEDAIECLLKTMKDNKIKKVVFSSDASEFKNEDPKMGVIENKAVDLKQLEIANLALEFAKKHKKKVNMLIWIKPHFEKNIQELETFYLKNKEFIHGLKVHPCLSKIKMTDPRMIPYIELARKYNLPICVHTAADEYSSILDLEKAAKKYLDVIFVAAHLELLSDNMVAIEVLKNNPNIYGDTAWVPIETINICKKENILDRIMFGTDNPIDKEKTYKSKIYQDYFKNTIKLSKKEYRNLMYKTAKKVYKIR